MKHWMGRVLALGGLLVCGWVRAQETWTPLFDGTTQKGWANTPFAGAGEVEVRDGTLVLNQGILTGVNWTNDFPTVDYELSLEAQRVLGIDFFCGLTFPVGTNHLSLIVGGWGGSVVGLSNIDGESANQNSTTHLERFESGRWYALKLRVVSTNVAVWLDGKQIIDLDTREKRLSLREGEIERSKPLGIAAWSTTAALRQIRWRSLVAPRVPAQAQAVLPPETRAAMDRLVSAMSASREGWDRLAELCDTFGARPSASPALESAVDWILERMRRDGLENVHGEPVIVPRWERGAESVEMLAPRRERLPMLGLGGSVGTPPGGLTAPVSVVTNFAELAQRSAEVRGRIVLFNVPFTEYGQTVRFRSQGAIEAPRRARWPVSFGRWLMTHCAPPIPERCATKTGSPGFPTRPWPRKTPAALPARWLVADRSRCDWRCLRRSAEWPPTGTSSQRSAGVRNPMRSWCWAGTSIRGTWGKALRTTAGVAWPPGRPFAG